MTWDEHGVLISDPTGVALLGQKPMTESLPVVIASDQTPVDVTVSGAPSGATRGMTFGQVVGASGTYQAIRRTAYNQPAANAQRSMSSAAAADTAAGAGARQVTITYYDQTMAGPFTEVVTLNGVAAVNTVAVDICYVEKMVVTSVGANGFNAGAITLFNAAAGAGGTLGVLGFGSVVAGRGDNTTLWCHHYVPTGMTCNIESFQAGTAQNQGAVAFLTRIDPTVATSAEVPITDGIAYAPSTQSVVRSFDVPIQVVGPARITGVVVPLGNNTTHVGGISFWEM